ncbi:MAG: glycosyltransferase [Alistipes finegoldii]|jgi:glycosyltransferase involved in cell wall biosynthesis|uniref:glycosyltransferase n=1 Tax=Alistipes finegoldii TaxID=214856 RepID=UPI001C3765CA|nr:glycosyltransferase [Alistipes finegoldii]MBV4325277.1 glycosyltransferase [Alistipes finegoldii]MBV4349286.1 glycosyltransferase [Alistipes finegoldii]MBV4370334.1 glycosyltransferase [Alistipes finegoldii]MCB6683257.1 glycosyltransferase [Alistipes finegoldii]MEE0828868.1 glycosyltransferase [Alistipes finegoldii]
MKIGFDDTPAAPAGTYSQHLARLLAEYAPEHEYIIDGKRCKEFDLYHGFRPGLPFPVLLRRIPCVMTVHNLNFLRYPHLYSLGERLVLLRLYRRMLRSASRVITVNRDAREELSDRLRIDPGRIEVVMPLAARMPQNPPDGAELEGVRRKYALPRDFVLMLGTVEPRHNQEVLFEALALLREREREMLETRGAEMPTAAERTEVRAAERTGAQAGMQSGTEAGTETGAETGTEAGAETGMRTGARTGEQPAGGAAERTGERAAGRNVESVAEAGAFAETVARSVREPDGGGDLNPENAGWRDDTASDGVGGYGDVEAGAGLAMRGVGEDTPDANRNTVAEFAPAGRERVRPADGTARSGGAGTDGTDETAGVVGVGEASGAADRGADMSVEGVCRSARTSVGDAGRDVGVSVADAGRSDAAVAAGRRGGAETAGRPPLPQRVGVVVCGRRTAYADFLLGYARERHMAARVDFIYELSPEDLPALFRLARTFVYLPDAEIEASIVPVVEALRAGLPMVLSDTRLNREAAGDAAVYVDPEAVGEVAAALENVLWDETFRSEMRRRERRRAELFSEYAVARRLIDIYTSL